MSTPEERAKHAAYIREWKARNPDKHYAITVRYEASEKGRETRRRAQRAWKQRNPERVRGDARVHMAVNHAIRAGRLVKGPCRDCGSTEVQGHHHNGYGPAHVLDVVWLCSAHHAVAHGRARFVA